MYFYWNQLMKTQLVYACVVLLLLGQMRKIKDAESCYVPSIFSDMVDDPWVVQDNCFLLDGGREFTVTGWATVWME